MALVSCGAEMQIERLRDFQGGLFLQREDVFHFAGEIVGPDLEAGGRVDQVDVDADLIAGFADGAFEQVTHTEFAAEVSRILICGFYSGDGRVRCDVDALNFGELGGDFVGHSVAEIGAVGIGAEILQR